MIPSRPRRAQGIELTATEHKALLETRRLTLDQATAKACGGQDMPVSWRWDWKAYIEPLGRDRDGSLRAQIRVVGPHASAGYVRKVRLVNRYRVNLYRS